MKPSEVIKIVEDVTGISLDDMKKRKPVTNLFARYSAMLLMVSECAANDAVISQYFAIGPGNVRNALMTADSLLQTNKTFKKIFMSCMGKLTEMEDAA